MVLHSLDKAYVVLEYRTAFSIHTATIPTREWNEPDVTFPLGWYQPWNDSGNRDAADMIADLIATFQPQMPTTTTFTRATIFTKEDADAPAIPRIASPLDTDGTAATPGYSAAVQLTITALDTEFWPAKLVLLDSGSFDNFDPILNAGDSAVVDAIFNEWSDVGNAWASRAGNRPASFKQATKTLNEKLRRAYRLD